MIEPKDTDLNKYLQPNNSPAAGTSEVVSGIEFMQTHRRDSITLNKIKNFSFNSGTGGTIVLGGTNNGNGLMLVKDSSGGTQVRIDNTGINVLNGSISVQNNGGTTIIDSKGLVSTTNFSNSSITASPNQDITATSPTTISGATFSINPTRTVNMLVLLTIRRRAFPPDPNAAASNEYIYGVYLDGTIQEPYIKLFPQMAYNAAGDQDKDGMSDTTLTTTMIISLSSGSHTLDFRAYKIVEIGNVTETLFDYSFSYIILGS